MTADIYVADAERLSDASRLAAQHLVAEKKPVALSIYAEKNKLPVWLNALVSSCRRADAEHFRAADWILDNDYQIRRAIKSIDTDLPASFYKRLVALEDPAGYPRVWAVTYALYNSIGNQLDAEAVEAFFKQYQSIAELRLAELWAIPSMLRLVCLNELILATQAFVGNGPKPVTSETGRAISGEDPVAAVSKAILILTSAASFRWDIFVDAVSLIEVELRRDPANIYTQMDLATRAIYRKAVEDLSDGSQLSQREIAGSAIELARENASSEYLGHVGYWLIDDGRPRLEATIRFRPGNGQRLSRLLRSHAGKTYATAMLLALLAVYVPPSIYLLGHDATVWEWLATAAIVMLPGSVLSVTIVHWLITRLTKPSQLPAMDFRQGVAEDCRTTIVVPVILTSTREIDHIGERLEVQWLSNSDPMFRIALLSDLFDAAQQVTPVDEMIKTKLAETVRRLNDKHGEGNHRPFVLLHRDRTWNESEGCWMGWERKRGKLAQFNDLTLTGDTRSFQLIEGDHETLTGARFAIVLDIDTDMSPASAAQLAAVLSHPLNRASFDPDTNRVKRGYTILQPRVEILPSADSGTYFSHWYSGDTAIDIYSRAVSDVYQDLFGTGIFVGKGIYDIAAVERSLAGQIPDNAILSHDLFEGALGRAGLVSNVVFYEDFPENYRAYALRLHRWIRGDWQLTPWLLPYVPTDGDDKVRNKLSALDRWKIIDNLRRSLIPPSLLLFFIAGWLTLPGSAWLWTALAIAAPGAHLFGETISAFTGGIRRSFLADIFHRLTVSGGRWFFSIVFLISDTLIAVDAIIRTLWRVFVSGKNLLEWTSAAHVAAHPANKRDRTHVWKMMWPSSAVALLLAIQFAAFDPLALVPALPVLALWLVAPEIAYWGSKPRRLRQETLDEGQEQFLRLVARRTWYFFESFAGPDDNWLPPDNFQALPRAKLAHRTSPTNIGMYLTSALAAHEFGFISRNDLLVRCRNALDAMDAMETHRGHLLNWYDTQTLHPLEPRYVSSVDSGNLAVALISLKQGLLELRDGSPVEKQLWQGLIDLLELLREAVQVIDAQKGAQVIEDADAFSTIAREAQERPLAWLEALERLELSWRDKLDKRLQDFLADIEGIEGAQLSQLQSWVERYHHHLRMMRRDLIYFFPWLEILAEAPEGFSFPSHAEASLFDTLNALQEDCLSSEFASYGSGTEDGGGRWQSRMRQAIEDGRKRLHQNKAEINSLAARADAWAFGMEFSFLYDSKLRLFHIGYNLTSGRLDPSHYDLLATEARLASFLAVAKGDVPVRHWFSFSRPITRIDGKPSILSWNGSMFEYLMPPLFLPSARDTLLGESEITAVDYQRGYAGQRNVPWGISESAFSATDAEGNYQYRAFGVPGLGIRRGLTEDLVISPYSSALALCVWPSSATKNLQALGDLGALSEYGFWEALDYTPSRLSAEETFVPVATYMAHHQGMVVGAILNVLHADRLVRWTMAESRFQAVDLILQERVPWEVPIETGRIEEAWGHEEVLEQLEIPGPWRPLANPGLKQFHSFGNGHMACRFSPSGDHAVTFGERILLRSAAMREAWPKTAPVTIRDLANGESWPLFDGEGHRRHDYLISLWKIETALDRNGIAVQFDTTVAPFEDLHIARFTVTNNRPVSSEIELDLYQEVVLAGALEQERHPAFSKLFVSSTPNENSSGTIFRRRPRARDQKSPFFFHAFKTADKAVRLTDWETDRAVWLGRKSPDRSALAEGVEQFTLDPVSAMRVHLSLKSGQRCEFVTLTSVAKDEETAIQTASRYSAELIERAFRDASLRSARQIARLEIPSAHLASLQYLQSASQDLVSALRKPVRDNSLAQQDLWRFGISGDFPIFLVSVESVDKADLVETLIRAHRLWTESGSRIDLVVLHTGHSGYDAPLRDFVRSALRNIHDEGALGRRAGVHMLAVDQMDIATRKALEVAAHAFLEADGRTLDEHISPMRHVTEMSPVFESIGGHPDLPQIELESPALSFETGYGGFDAESGDYVIRTRADERLPAPWCNVLANDCFGTIVSEAGLGFTWFLNSGEYRITPWSNDPVIDPQNESVFLRDEATSDIWPVIPAGQADAANCIVTHGAGWSGWRSGKHGIEQEIHCFVDREEAVKIVRLRLRNRSEIQRRLTATYVLEWLLGSVGSIAKPHMRCHFDDRVNALVARNGWNNEFAGQMAFLTANSAPHSYSGNLSDIRGTDRTRPHPGGLDRWDLGERMSEGGEAGAAYQVHIELAPGEEATQYFVLGSAGTDKELERLTQKWRDAETCETAFERTISAWKDRLRAVQVTTPDPAFDLMVNRWLPYQNLASRIMARAGFYQAGGAYGFRDQLQDVLALLYAEPDRARAQILRAAHHQFEEGDVLHWWHPPAGRGVRTRCSDDYLWLPFVTARYVDATADVSILDEVVPFLTAPELEDDEDDRYALFDSRSSGTIYEHCVAAIERGFARGEHGLPLMGAGDWNDGMDRIGDEGRGESVWLAWFQIATIEQMIPLAGARGETDRTANWKRHAADLKSAVTEHAWDGNWFLRAFDDEGKPWGSKKNSDCQIDSISQSWSVLSGGAPAERAEIALANAYERLVRHDERLVLLLDPPFRSAERDPGYIAAYPPGIRENGGQYTHSSAWLGLAFAVRGDGDRAYDIFDMINPIKRSLDRKGADHYMREPFVLTGDVGGGDFAGRGGWSWYTGSAGWAWQLAIHGIFGVGLRRGGITLEPRLPTGWDDATLSMKNHRGAFEIRFKRVGKGGAAGIEVDGKPFKGTVVRYPGKDRTRNVVVSFW